MKLFRFSEISGNGIYYFLKKKKKSVCVKKKKNQEGVGVCVSVSMCVCYVFSSLSEMLIIQLLFHSTFPLLKALNLPVSSEC